MRTDASDDPRRWFTLAIVIMSAFIVVLDNTVLNVAVPTILREFATTLPALQWVITGYALTFASLLIIGGRLGDVYGPRRMFMIGAIVFGFGSLLASLAHSVPQLVVGESVIEGIGASLMMPATLGILSNTFRGRERATAFAAWGATIGAGVAFGPTLGGYLTTYHSWRWAFRVNVIVAPVVVVGALLFMRRDQPREGHLRLDLPGAVLIASGTFLLVFGISEAATYGWITPLTGLSVAGHMIWPSSRPVSVVPLAFVLAVALLFSFFRVERAKERAGAGPLFEFGELRHRTYRYGLLTSMVLSSGQFGMLFVLPVFLQETKHLSAMGNGYWLVPMGVAILISAQIGGRLTRVVGTTTIVRTGLVCNASGLVLMGILLRPGVSFLGALPALILFGFGNGLAGSQLTNVVLSEIDPDKAGVASGANSTARQVGSALGVALISSVLTTQTVHRAIEGIRHSSLSAAAKAQTIAEVHRRGISIGTGAPSRLTHIVGSAIAGAARPSLLLAGGILGVGLLLSFLIPPVDQRTPRVDEAVDLYDLIEPVDTHMAG